MNNKNLIGPWIRRFLTDHLLGERNLARNTQESYRDTLALLIPFISDISNKPPDLLLMTEDLSSDVVSSFLLHLEQHRNCSVSTRNQRLAVIHALVRFISERSPEHIT